MENKAVKYLDLSLRIILEWLPIDHAAMMSAYEKHGGYAVEEFQGRVYCLFSIPFLKKDGTLVKEFVENPALELMLVFVYEGDGIIADNCVYHLASSELFNKKVFSFLEDESDWLYWEAEILGELLYGEDFAEEGTKPAHDEDVDLLLYSNMYVSINYRRQGIARHMVSMVEREISSKGEYEVVCSCISLDPDLPCYGPDKLESTYVYSMKDEPARILNSRIIERLGFEVLKLETDEEVEDGCLLWFAVRKQAYMFV